MMRGVKDQFEDLRAVYLAAKQHVEGGGCDWEGLMPLAEAVQRVEEAEEIGTVPVEAQKE